MFLALIITNICFVGVAFVTNEENAEHLLSGYNTMSKDEKESFDLKNYLIFFNRYNCTYLFTSRSIRIYILYHVSYSKNPTFTSF